MNPFDILFEDIDMEMSTRLMNCVEGENMVTLGDIANRTQAEWLRCPNFGRKTLIELEWLLAEFGLSLRPHNWGKIKYAEPKQNVVPMQWQDMKTAPLDGTRVILFYADDVRTGCFCQGFWLMDQPGEVRINEEPSYWMHLPRPPKVANDAP